MNFVLEVEFGILNFIQNVIKCDALDFIMTWITKLGDHGIVPIVIGVVLLIIPKTRKIGTSMAFAFSYGGIFGNLILKNLIARPRPYDESYALRMLSECDLLIDGLNDFSFPSGHTLIVFELAIVLLLMLKGRKRIIAVVASVIAALVAFSRLYLYVHFPSDVIVGAVLGSIFAVIGIISARFVFKLIGKHSDK